MKHWLRKAQSLIEAATRDVGQVRFEPPQAVLLELRQGPKVRLTLTPLEAGLPAEDPTGQTIWMLRRPRQSFLRELRATGQSFVTLDGRVRIQAPGVLIDRSDVEPPNDYRPNASSRSAFSDRASLIPRWLFEQSAASEWTVSRVAEEANVSVSVASYAIRDLEARGLVDVRPEGRKRYVRLTSHADLVSTWAREYSWDENSILAVQAPIGSPARFLHRLETFPLPRHALTLQAGASVLWAHSPVEKIALYVDASSEEELLQLARTLGWAPAKEARLLFLKPHYSSSIWKGVRRVSDGLPVVSDLQLILDLWDHPLRGREQAEIVLEKHLMALEAM